MRLERTINFEITNWNELNFVFAVNMDKLTAVYKKLAERDQTNATTDLAQYQPDSKHQPDTNAEV